MLRKLQVPWNPWSARFAAACALVVATLVRGEPAFIAGESSTTARLPLLKIKDVDLPGRASRFDYQDIDYRLGQLVIAHMNDGAVLFVDLRDGSLLKRLEHIPVARGVAVAEDAGLVFVTSSPNTLVILDARERVERKRVETGRGPDGVAWDPIHKIVGVSDQFDGALSLLADSGSGARRDVELGAETGNVVFDPKRAWFWITVVTPKHPDALIAVEPRAGTIAARIALPDCRGAHGLRLDPNQASAFIACEANSRLVRVELEGRHAASSAPTGADPDVLALDPGLGWLYVAAESGELSVFALDKPGVTLLGRDRPGKNSHSIAVDATTHRVFFPLSAGPKGTPVLRIMKPSGS